jgi:hypothetical protein
MIGQTCPWFITDDIIEEKSGYGKGDQYYSVNILFIENNI